MCNNLFNEHRDLKFRLEVYGYSISDQELLEIESKLLNEYRVLVHFVSEDHINLIRSILKMIKNIREIDR